MTTADGEPKITREECVALFGSTIPMEAVVVLCDKSLTLGEARERLRELAAGVSDQGRPVGREDAPAHWHILTVTKGGVVSLLKNLTEDVARQTMQRLPLLYHQIEDPYRPEQTVVSARYAAEREAWGKASKATRDAFSAATLAYWPQFHGGSELGITKAECWGPDEEALVVWPKPADYDERYAAALDAARAEVAKLPRPEPDLPVEMKSSTSPIPKPARPRLWNWSAGERHDRT